MSVLLCKVMKEIVLTKGKVSIVDDDDYEKVACFKWQFSASSKIGYAVRTIKNRTEYLHWSIIGKPGKGLVVDHINRNSLDNRKKNLRFATLAENRRNFTKKTSKYIGVWKNRAGGKFHAKMKLMGKRLHFGSFNTEEEAAIAYDKAAKKYYGEFATLNKNKTKNNK